MFISSVTERVCASGCLTILKITPSWPSIAPLPRIILAPSTTEAISPSRRGRPSIALRPIEISCNSSASAGAVRIRMTYSFSFSVRIPPLLFVRVFSTLLRTSSIIIPCRRIFSALMFICHSRTSPPMTKTFATPEVLRSAGRIVQSASVRSSIGVTFGSDDVMPTHMISPNKDVEGPSVGFTPNGNIA